LSIELGVSGVLPISAPVCQLSQPGSHIML
jgi:hypothetical protein